MGQYFGNLTSLYLFFVVINLYLHAKADSFLKLLDWQLGWLDIW